MPSMKIYGALFAILVCCTIQSHSQGTTREERTVSARQQYKCQYDGACYNLRFATAEEGCKHWATHLPGYTYQKVESINEIGAVTCICKKGSMVNDQGGMIRGEIVCADELAVPITENKTFLESKTCECPDKLSPPYYVAHGDKCVIDTCTIKEMSQEALLQWATTRLQQIVDEENKAFAANTARVNDSNVVGPKPLFSDKEIQGIGDKFGTRVTPSGNEKLSDASWAIIYGHAIERLAAARVKKDLCLNRILQYIPNVQQTRSGGQPDFKHKAPLKSGEFDVTTPEEAKRKSGEGKSSWIFITYTRLIMLDENGNNVPVKPKKP
jgi:hypothetical protein